MQKTEYICDRCGANRPAERMWKFTVNRVLMLQGDAYGRTPNEIIKQWEKDFLHGLSRDLCEDCLAKLREWLG